LFKEFGTKLKFSTSYHPQTYGHTERINQVIEDMLRMYVMDQPYKWENYLYLVEFYYKNGYQASLKTSPFEAIYGRRCNILVSWDKPVGLVIIGPKMIEDLKNMWKGSSEI